jgi:hypothetical protein
MFTSYYLAYVSIMMDRSIVRISSKKIAMNFYPVPFNASGVFRLSIGTAMARLFRDFSFMKIMTAKRLDASLLAFT